jgi:phosphatidylglycerophosphate synthase
MRVVDESNSGASTSLWHAVASDGWWAGAWVLTALRVPLLAATLAAILSRSQPSAVCVLVGLIVLADMLDGQFFEWSARNQDRLARRRRRCVDTVGDRIVIHSVWIAALGVYDIPLALYGLVVAREILLAIAVLRPLVRFGIVVRANTPSKLGTAFVAVLGVNQIAGVLPAALPLAGFLVFSAVGLYLYLYRYEEC